MFSKSDLGAQARVARIANDTNHPFAGFATLHKPELEASMACNCVGAIISDGQTGTDTAAFTFAAERGIPRFGFAPRGFINECGDIREDFQKDLRLPDREFGKLEPLTVAEEERYHAPYARTPLYAECNELNARYSCATLILAPGELSGATLETSELVKRFHPSEHVYTLDLTKDLDQQSGDARWWLAQLRPVFLNVSGPLQNSNEHLHFNILERSLEALRAAIPARNGFY